MHRVPVNVGELKIPKNCCALISDNRLNLIVKGSIISWLLFFGTVYSRYHCFLVTNIEQLYMNGVVFLLVLLFCL